MARRTPRILLGALISIIVLAAILIGLLIFFIRRPFPQVEGTLQVPGLQAPVEVIRDRYGIPHIYASNEHDLYMAQGFVHAQDRFWQMEFWRRIGSGRLSEILGPSALDQDRFIRTLGWHRTAAQELELLEPAYRQILEDYAQGVNAYLEQNRGRLSLEFTILGLTGVRYDPEPWTPLNTMTWAKVMAWDLGGNRTDELARAHVVARVGAPALQELMPPYAADKPTIIPASLSQASLESLPAPMLELNALGIGDGIGSNNWVLSGDRTESGMPILANDPHLGIQMPSIWYEVGLHCAPTGPDCPLNLVGASFAGVPGIVIGHNDRIAWGVTNLGPDVQDFFIERVNPENPNQYEFRGQWEDMEVIREEIRVAGEDDPVVIFIRRTRHGPILNDVVGGTEEAWAFGWQPLAFSWTALEPGTLVKSLLMTNHAQDWESFREALSFWDAPSQNFVYADVDGNIGYQAPGRIPIRAAGDGSIPVPGWTGEYEWTGYIPFDELPSAFNPDQGYLVTANNAVVGPDYPYLLSQDWSPGYRAARIVEMIESREKHSLEDIQAMQGDNLPLYAEEILPYILDLQSETPDQAQALDILRSWDRQARRESTGAALFESLRVHLLEAIFADELGVDLLDGTAGNLMAAVSNLLPNAESRWFDDVYTPEAESRDEILLRALDAAIADLREMLGKDMAAWQWGDLHTATFRNQSLGQSGIAPIERLFNRGPFPVDGAVGTVNNTAYSLRDPYKVSTVPSYRQIIDLQYLEISLSMHTTGQSGHAFHPHYDDMIDPWRNIEYHPMLWTRGQVESAAEAHLTLIP